MSPWTHPEVSFEQLQMHVKNYNQNIQLSSRKESEYTTYFGNLIQFIIWSISEQDSHHFGYKILNIDNAGGDPR